MPPFALGMRNFPIPIFLYRLLTDDKSGVLRFFVIPKVWIRCRNVLSFPRDILRIFPVNFLLPCHRLTSTAMLLEKIIA